MDVRDKYRKTVPKGNVIITFNPKTYRYMAPNTVTFINAKHARGVDFRAKTGHGIELFAMCQLPNDRALIQLMGRVGRYG